LPIKHKKEVIPYKVDILENQRIILEFTRQRQDNKNISYPFSWVIIHSDK